MYRIPVLLCFERIFLLRPGSYLYTLDIPELMGGPHRLPRFKKLVFVFSGASETHGKDAYILHVFEEPSVSHRICVPFLHIEIYILYSFIIHLIGIRHATMINTRYISPVIDRLNENHDVDECSRLGLRWPTSL